MAKIGEQWIESKEKRVFELAVLGTLAPGIGAVAATASATARISGNKKVIYAAPRSLYPGNTFTMKKLGDPASNQPLLRLFRKAMIDEIPQTANIVRGDMTLVGPRADTPAHIFQLFDAIEDTGLRNEWEAVRAAQKPGIISSYAVHSHRHNLAGETEAARFSETELRQKNAQLRAELDILDFHGASLESDTRLMLGTVHMAVSNYRAYANQIGSRILPTR